MDLGWDNMLSVWISQGHIGSPGWEVRHGSFRFLVQIHQEATFVTLRQWRMRREKTWLGCADLHCTELADNSVSKYPPLLTDHLSLGYISFSVNTVTVQFLKVFLPTSYRWLCGNNDHRSHRVLPVSLLPSVKGPGKPAFPLSGCTWFKYCEAMNIEEGF